MKRLCIVLLLTGLAAARPFQVTTAGKVTSQQGDHIVVVADDGSTWCGLLLPGARRKLALGQTLMFRLQGGLGEIPRRIDRVVDWQSSRLYVERGIPTPPFVPQGTWAGPTGVGGVSPGTPDLGKIPNTGAHAVNGGFPHQNTGGLGPVP